MTSPQEQEKLPSSLEAITILLETSTPQERAVICFVIAIALSVIIGVGASLFLLANQEKEPFLEPTVQLDLIVAETPYAEEFRAVFTSETFARCQSVIRDAGVDFLLSYELSRSQRTIQEATLALQSGDDSVMITPEVTRNVATDILVDVHYNVPYLTEDCNQDLAQAKHNAITFLSSHFLYNNLFRFEEVWMPYLEEDLQALPERVGVEGVVNPLVLDSTQYYRLLKIPVSTQADIFALDTLQLCAAEEFRLNFVEVLSFNGLVFEELLSTDPAGSSGRGDALRRTYQITVPVAMGHDRNFPQTGEGCSVFRVRQPNDGVGSITARDLTTQLSAGRLTATLNDVIRYNGLTVSATDEVSTGNILAPTEYSQFSPFDRMEALDGALILGEPLMPGALLNIPR